MTRTVIESGRIIDTKGAGDDVCDTVDDVSTWAEHE